MPKSTDAIVDKSVIRGGVVTITASQCVQCLGICIDRHLEMKKHVSPIISVCPFHLRNIIQINHFLPTKERVVNAIMTLLAVYCVTRYIHIVGGSDQLQLRY